MDDPVAAHIEAYNERDLDRFVECFAPDCVMEDGQGAVLARGHADLQRHFAVLFRDNPELHCEILHRVRVGDYVVDEEHITGRAGGEQRAVVVSHVSDGLIDHQRVVR
jgi:hypothetical protein